MEALIILGILLSSLAAGLLGSMLGLGGGVFIIPSLVLIFGLPMQEAIGASLVGVIATSTGAATYYVQEGLSNIRLGMVLETTTTLGSIAGALLAVYLEQTVLAVIFGLLLFYSSYHMIRRPQRLAPPGKGGREVIGLGGRYRESGGNEISYTVRNLEKGLGAGFFAGNMSGLLGVGGGSVKVPVMNLWMGVPMKASVATSNFMIGVTALAGAVVYYGHGLISPVTTGAVAMGVFIGATIGSRIAHTVPSDSLRGLFALILVVIGGMMILRAAGVLP